MKRNPKIHIYFKVILFAVFFAVSMWIPCAYYFLSFQTTVLDPEYAVFTANDEVITQTYPIDQCDSLWFFHSSASTGEKRTLFINAIPEVRIINDESYYIQLTTNQSVHDVISIDVRDSILDIDIQDDCHNSVYVDDTSYDYDHGLYVDCSEFVIMIYAPISKFYTNTQSILEFDVAKADNVSLCFSFEGTKANIYNIDANSLYFTCSGDSDVMIRGSVSEEATLKIWHNTHVDARNLIANAWDVFVSNQPLGISYILRSFGIDMSPFDLGWCLSMILIGFPIVWFYLLVKNLRSLRKVPQVAV